MSNEKPYTDEEFQAMMTAAEAIHTATCDPKGLHEWKHCIAGRSLVNMATIEAIRHLRQFPRDAAKARLILHDYCCMSGCTGDGAADHAKRQSKTVAALRKHLAA